MLLYITYYKYDIYIYICIHLCIYRHFGHVIKSGIFKNRNLRRIADPNFRGNFLKNHFRHLKFYSNPPG